MYVLLDIGGSKTRVAASLDLNDPGKPIVIDTLQKYDDALHAIGTAAVELTAGTSVTKIAIGMKGILNQDKRSIHSSGQGLLDWKDKQLASDLENILHAPVMIENDNALVGLGEAVYGAGKGVSRVVYYTVSTGVNGVRVVDGRLDSLHYGAEAGGQYISMNPQKTVEELVSGSAITERYGVLPVDLGKESPVWEELARTFAFALHNSILHWSPDRVVLGGSMFNEIGISVPRVEEHVKSLMRKFPDIPEIVHSSLGDFGGLWGGMALLKKGV